MPSAANSVSPRKGKPAFPEMEEYLDRHRDKMVCLAHQRVHDWEAAEEIVQEACLEAFRYRHTFRLSVSAADGRPCTPFEIWFRRIVCNHCFKHTEKSRRDRVVFSFDVLVSWEAWDGWHDQEGLDMRCPSAEAQVLGAFDSEREREWMAQALATLGAAERDLLSDVYFCGKPRPEIAAALGVTTDTLRVRLFEARRRLHNALGLHPAKRFKEQIPS